MLKEARVIGGMRQDPLSPAMLVGDEVPTHFGAYDRRGTVNGRPQYVLIGVAEVNVKGRPIFGSTLVSEGSEHRRFISKKKSLEHRIHVDDIEATARRTPRPAWLLRMHTIMVEQPSCLVAKRIGHESAGVKTLQYEVYFTAHTIAGNMLIQRNAIECDHRDAEAMTRVHTL